MKYVALLRGINVGKNVQVPMKDLKLHLEHLGCRSVVTYLNSGNAIFDSDLPRGEVASSLEGLLEKVYGQKIPTLVKTAEEIVEIARALPAEWQNDETQQTYVAYLFPEAVRPDLVDELPVRRQYMTLLFVHGCLIWNIPRENYNKSHITKIVAHPAYALMTTRNSNTARKLAELCTAPEEA